VTFISDARIGAPTGRTRRWRLLLLYHELRRAVFFG